MENRPVLSGGSAGRGWRFWLGMALSVIALLWLIATINWPAAWRALRQTDYRLVALALGLNLASIPWRTMRWQGFFPPETRPPFGKLTAAMLIGQAVNIIAPARLGDLVRASLVETERTVYVLGTLVIQTVLDLLMVAALVLVLLFQVTLPDWWRGSGQVLLVTSVVAVGGVAGLILGRKLVARRLAVWLNRWPALKKFRVLDMADHFLRSFDMVSRPLVLMRALGWSVVIWIFYGAVNYVLLAAVGAPLSMLAAFFLLVVLQLGVAIPSSPGRVGVYHYLSVAALAVFGVDGPRAVSYAIILHFISVIVPVAVGALLAGHMGVSFTRPQPEA